MFFVEVRAWLRATAGTVPGARVEVATVTYVQRFGGSLNLNLNPHLHMLVADGVFACGDDGRTPTFVATAAPTRDARRGVIVRVIARTRGAAKRATTGWTGCGARREAAGPSRVDGRGVRDGEAGEETTARRVTSIAALVSLSARRVVSMTMSIMGVRVVEKGAGLRVERWLPPWGAPVVAAAFVLGGGLLAFEAGFGVSDAAALLVVFGLTGAAMSRRVKSLAQRPVVRQMKRSLAIEPEHAGDGYRDARRPATVSIDGHERPLGDLRRVSVEREITVMVNSVGGITHPVTAGAVALLFDESMVQVARASAVDDAVALAERIAGAAGLNADWLSDRIVGVSGTQDLSSSGRVGGERGLGLVQAAAMHNAESLVPRPYGDHLPRSRSIAMALLVVTGASAALIGVTGVVLALGDRWRWGAGPLAMVVWMAVDAAVLRACAAVVRPAALAHARATYGLGGDQGA